MEPAIKITDTTLEIIRVFDAPEAELYRAWIEPETMNKWYYPREGLTSSCTVDLRVGGSYEVHLQGADTESRAIGVYHVIEPEKKLVFTWGWADEDTDKASLVTLFFRAVGDNASELKFLHEGINAKNPDGYSKGWPFGFDQMAKALV